MKIHTLLLLAISPLAFTACTESEVEKTKAEVTTAAGDLADKTKDAFEEAKEATAEGVDKAKDATAEGMEKAKDASATGLDKIKEAAGNAADKLRED